MAFLALLVFSALSVSAVAGWFSIVGLMAIFPAAAIPILTMGAVLEVAKLVTASWLYRNWNSAGVLLKSYFTAAVVTLSIITSIGIFGFLSKAHIEQTVNAGGNNELQIETLERRIAYQQTIIKDAETVLAQLDTTVETLIEYDRIRGETGAIATRQSQKEERDSLNQQITAAYSAIEETQTALLPLQKEQLSLEAEVGPLKYIAELIYGDEAQDHFDAAVRWIIILIVLVFDPLAILLVISANMTWMRERGEVITAVNIDDTVVEEEIIPEPEIPEPEPSPPSAVDDAANVMSGLDDTQLRKLDRSTRKKLEWLIDKGVEVKGE
tara:strand:- start:4935 stop:5909 length:975 start_codon:yes stop_codon:yes gene_type:complete